MNGSILLNRNKIFDFASKSLKKVMFLNDFIKKNFSKRITESAREHNMAFIFNFISL